MIEGVSEETRHVPDGPVAAVTPVAPVGGDATRHVADGPVAPRSASGALPSFGRFRATAKLGAGGMGIVYRAHDDVLGRDVAIKMVHADSDPATRERFLREAKAIGAVLHPNILAVYDAGTADGTPYLVMELCTGGSLRERIAAGPLPVETVREMGIQISRALAAAHARGIVHRDVKPGNILAAQAGTWKLADFGIARLPDSTLTITGQFVGSPSYAAPESLRAGQFGGASDVYSLGATLYEAVSGVPPHGDHDMQSIVRKLETDPPPLASRRAVPGPLSDAIMAALARDPARRPTAEQLAAALAVTPYAPQPAAAAPTGMRQLRGLAILLAALAVIIVIIAVQDRSSSAPTNPAVIPSGLTEQQRAHAASQDREDTPASAEPANDSTGEPGESAEGEPGEPGMPGEPAAPTAPTVPTVVDQFGNPVDDATAKAILDQMQRDAQSVAKPGHGHGHGKKH